MEVNDRKVQLKLQMITFKGKTNRYSKNSFKTQNLTLL